MYSRAKSASGQVVINDSALAMLMLLNSGHSNEDFARVLSSTAASNSADLTPAMMKNTLH